MMDDLISREAAINNIKNGFHWETVNGIMAQAVLKQVIHDIEIMPSVQPEITDEQAIDHLQSTGWMQNHDREMYDMGLKEQLADDSGSYDSLLPSAQPTPCDVCRHNPPSSMDGKPCCICPAEGREG